jgi:ABC-2 type transport system permease protein
MMRSLRAELLKLWRPSVIYGGLAGLLGLSILATALIFATAKNTPGPPPLVNGNQLGSKIGLLGQAGGLTQGFATAAGFLCIVWLVLFITSVTSEYGLGTVRVLVARQPRRVQLLSGKLVAIFLCVAAGLLVAEAGGLAAAVVAAHVRGVSTASWFTSSGLAQVGSAYVNALLAAALYGAVGTTVGLLVRSTPLALAAALVWVLPVEHIINLAWNGASQWFPGLLLDAIAAGGTSLVSYERALLLGIVYGTAALVVGGIAFVRRDIVE